MGHCCSDRGRVAMARPRAGVSVGRVKAWIVLKYLLVNGMSGCGGQSRNEDAQAFSQPLTC